MNEKMANQIAKMKEQTIGVEVEMNHITRQKAAKVAADYFGTGRYEDTARRNGYSTWSAWDANGCEWKFQKDVSIAGDDAHKCELVTPILTYNDIENLQCLDHHDHLRHHGNERFKENPEPILESFAKAVEAAKEWHGTEAGREWHKEHFEKCRATLFAERDYTCQICGKVFKSTKLNAKYCCNAHKSTARRRSGVDNITAFCEVCGAPFVKNKYSKIMTCSRKCAGIKRSMAKNCA